MSFISNCLIPLACIILAIQGQLYDLEFKENGQTYKEMITVDKVNQIIVFDVPTHGNRSAATYLKDFINRLTVMRDDEAKTCYVWKMKKDEPTPDSVLKALKKVNYKFPQNRYWIETENMLPMGVFDLSPYPIIDQFCDKRRVLEVNIYANITDMERDAKADLLSRYSNNRARRSLKIKNYNLCNEGSHNKEIKRCYYANKMHLLSMTCQILDRPKCTYTVSCKFDKSKKGYICPDPIHDMTQIHCCDPKCNW